MTMKFQFQFQSRRQVQDVQCPVVPTPGARARDDGCQVTMQVTMKFSTSLRFSTGFTRMTMMMRGNKRAQVDVRSE